MKTHHIQCTIWHDICAKNQIYDKQIRKQRETKSYFCNPYHSWEKGSVENSIGLVRRFLPKKTDFAKLSSQGIACIEYHLNTRPRKCLNYKTPLEVFNSCVALAR
jgi:IS30 family transposase